MLKFCPINIVRKCHSCGWDIHTNDRYTVEDAFGHLYHERCLDLDHRISIQRVKEIAAALASGETVLDATQYELKQAYDAIETERDSVLTG